MPATGTIRSAKVGDVPAICDLINYYAERGLMLHRSRQSAYESVRDFCVAEDQDGTIIGCVALAVFWSDLAEVRSLAIAPDRRGEGTGSRLLCEALRGAANLGIGRVFTLTYERDFFVHHGFAVIDRESLPEKVWRVCLACPKADACDETAMMILI